MVAGMVKVNTFLDVSDQGLYNLVKHKAQSSALEQDDRPFICIQQP
jgi:hypothetical protein